ncbi:alpha/beta fold hydrolase [Sulfobacillus thermosulfidooxidans]|uniref:alpha/beta fold hydrolase n=1 Tax=Sulfobacillus thermosulfidooxidans TaxID=28034 RepID=UPI0006B4C3FA|nr:alpha/beta hydrolase [Sulfobacillus thermosulfidooxidans]
MGAIVRVRGTRLWVEDLGDSNRPVVLYLHGGPGSGCYDFVLYQGQRLATSVRLIAMDQRGVLRSDLLGNQTLSLRDLVEDAEALRKHLGISRWSVIGHSFGGYVGLLYSSTYPDAIDRLIFENPTFDLAASARSLLQHTALEYGVLGNQEKARECLAIASDDALDSRFVWDKFTVLSQGLGKQRDNLYVYGPDKQFFQRLVRESSFGDELWKRGADHQAALYEEGAIFDSLISRFSQITHPTLFIRGYYDAVFGLDQIHRCLETHPHSKLMVADASSHFVHVEQPELFAAAVVNWMA